MTKVITVDIDGTIARLLPVWLNLYNSDYGDALQEWQITDWDLTKFVKPECGSRIYDYIENPAIYDIVTPYPYARRTLQFLRDRGNRIVFVTSATIGAAGRKLHWLREHGFLSFKIGKPEPDYIECYDKSLVRADLIIDDNFNNVWLFPGRAILMTRPWNEAYDWPDRAKSWSELRTAFRSGRYD